MYGSCLALKGTAFDDACRKAGKYGLVQYGSTGTLTAIAEGILSARGYYRGNIDAQFGSEMDRAVRAFQSAEALAVDGVIGEDTWEVLFRKV